MSVPVIQQEAKDNQWWFSGSPLRERVEASPYIHMTIDGRLCPMKRAERGSDGRPTLSFKFIRNDDRRFWRSLSGKTVTLDLIDLRESPPDVDDDQDDEYQPIAEILDDYPENVGQNVIEDSTRAPINRSTRATLFDAYIFVDWSANNRPKTGKDSIWIGEAWFEDNILTWDQRSGGYLNPRTRESAFHNLESRLQDHLKHNRRTLLCLDFPYALPQCQESTRVARDWKDFWNLLSTKISDNAKNQSNRFEVADEVNCKLSSGHQGPFWGRPTAGKNAALESLLPTKPTDWQDRTAEFREFRVVEQRLKLKFLRPFSVWQLYGNGSVGSQSLVGIPRLGSLRNHPKFRECSRVWPFETGWNAEFSTNEMIIHAEFWPGTFVVNESLHRIKDAAQVLSCVDRAASLDQQGELKKYFDPLAQEDPDRDTARNEGWILGFLA